MSLQSVPRPVTRRLLLLTGPRELQQVRLLCYRIQKQLFTPFAWKHLASCKHVKLPLKYLQTSTYPLYIFYIPCTYPFPSARVDRSQVPFCQVFCVTRPGIDPSLPASVARPHSLSLIQLSTATFLHRFLPFS